MASTEIKSFPVTREDVDVALAVAEKRLNPKRGGEMGQIYRQFLGALTRYQGESDGTVIRNRSPLINNVIKRVVRDDWNKPTCKYFTVWPGGWQGESNNGLARDFEAYAYSDSGYSGLGPNSGGAYSLVGREVYFGVVSPFE